MKVYLVKVIVDDEYFCRDVVFVASDYDKAWEYIEKQGGQKIDKGWDDRERPFYVVEEWKVDI